MHLWCAGCALAFGLGSVASPEWPYLWLLALVGEPPGMSIVALPAFRIA